MEINVYFTERDNWIGIELWVNGVNQLLNQNSLSFEELAGFFSQVIPAKVRITVLSDKEWLVSRSYRVCSYLKSRHYQSFPNTQFQIEFKKVQKQATILNAYKRGLLSYFTGVYPEIPQNCIKHIFIPDNVSIENSDLYFRKAAINSAMIIEVSTIKEMEEKYKRLDLPQIIHFKLKDVYYLNYPFGKKVVMPGDDTYQIWQEMMADNKLISLEIGDGLRKSHNFFEMEGGVSINRIVLSSEDSFTIGGKQEYRLFEMDSVVTKDIPLISKLWYESSRFARLCGMEKYRIVAQEEANVRFSDGLIEKTLDLSTYQVR
ncbi:hypothetical protein [Enterococcus ureasiticus]|uniref:Uncharacterized protein n=1 Tax=Enterococcus ureasiticus TaxID=903984 RepID=A0A1E5G8H1_9ENTE|nr:hypothetical protein [Enterococcus ureasiticus]OEG09008.1 hypothetical protein BCR21_15650 [Enterococcus ureasiticus]